MNGRRQALAEPHILLICDCNGLNSNSIMMSALKQATIVQSLLFHTLTVTAATSASSTATLAVIDELALDHKERIEPISQHQIALAFVRLSKVNHGVNERKPQHGRSIRDKVLRDAVLLIR